MTNLTLTQERTLSAHLCLAHATGTQAAVRLTCPLPHTDEGARLFASAVTLHSDAVAVWATHEIYCGGRFELGDIAPLSTALFDRLYADAEPEPAYANAGPLARRLSGEVCVPRLLGQVEHEHAVGRLAELAHYSIEHVDGTGIWTTSCCRRCQARTGFAAEHDRHRMRIWCGNCGHSWVDGVDTRFGSPLTDRRDVHGEQAAETAALALLGSAASAG